MVRSRTRYSFRPGAPVRPERPVPALQYRPTGPGLVFVGADTVPGVGVPMVLLSGKLAAARVQAMAS